MKGTTTMLPLKIVFAIIIAIIAVITIVWTYLCKSKLPKPAINFTTSCIIFATLILAKIIYPELDEIRPYTVLCVIAAITEFILATLFVRYVYKQLTQSPSQQNTIEKEHSTTDKRFKSPPSQGGN